MTDVFLDDVRVCWAILLLPTLSTVSKTAEERELFAESGGRSRDAGENRDHEVETWSRRRGRIDRYITYACNTYTRTWFFLYCFVLFYEAREQAEDTDSRSSPRRRNQTVSFWVGKSSARGHVKYGVPLQRAPTLLAGHRRDEFFVIGYDKNFSSGAAPCSRGWVSWVLVAMVRESVRTEKKRNKNHKLMREPTKRLIRTTEIVIDCYRT